MGLGTSWFGLWLSSLYHLLATYTHLAMGELSVDSLEHELIAPVFSQLRPRR
jgi:hypothetical protein